MKPSERQRTITGAMCWAPDPPTEPGKRDGKLVEFVINGKPQFPGLARMIAAANTNPPAEERAPIQTMTSAVATQRARRRG